MYVQSVCVCVGAPLLVAEGCHELAVHRVGQSAQSEEAAEEGDALDEQLAKLVERFDPNLLLKRRVRLHIRCTSDCMLRGLERAEHVIVIVIVILVSRVSVSHLLYTVRVCCAAAACISVNSYQLVHAHYDAPLLCSELIKCRTELLTASRSAVRATSAQRAARRPRGPSGHWGQADAIRAMHVPVAARPPARPQCANMRVNLSIAQSRVESSAMHTYRPVH